MPDEQTPAPVEDQPQVDAPTQDAPDQGPAPSQPDQTFAETFDPAALPDELRGRYQQMQADYTQKTQALSEQRREAEAYQQVVAALVDDDPEVRAQALSALGYDFQAPEEQPDEPFNDPTEERLNQHEAYIQQQAQAQQEAELGQFVNDHLDHQWTQLEQTTGREFSDNQKHTIERIAATVPDEQGLPDLGQAYELYAQHLGEERQNWIESKKAPQIPVGRQGEPKIDLTNDDDARVRHMAQVAEANLE